MDSIKHLTPQEQINNLGQVINIACEKVHQANKKWWYDLSKPCACCKDLRKFLPIHLQDTGLMATRWKPVEGQQNLWANPECKDCKGEGYVRKQRNVGELLMLTVSELSEAMEGHRKNLKDDKLPHRSMFEVELADTLIRLLDIAGGMGLDLGGAFAEKMAFNAQRPDHKIEARLGENGKKY